MASSARIDELRKKFDENPRRYFAPLANEYRKAGDPEQAIFICQEYLPQQPGHMSGHIVYGQALFDLGRLDEARAVFETALSLDPENLIALRHLGDIARHGGDSKAARGWYQRVLEADPRNEEIAQLMLSLLGTPEGSHTPVPSQRATPAFSDTDQPSQFLGARAADQADVDEGFQVEKAEGEPSLPAAGDTDAAAERQPPAALPPTPAYGRASSAEPPEELLDLDELSVGGVRLSALGSSPAIEPTPSEPFPMDPFAEPSSSESYIEDESEAFTESPSAFIPLPYPEEEPAVEPEAIAPVEEQPSLYGADDGSFEADPFAIASKPDVWREIEGPREELATDIALGLPDDGTVPSVADPSDESASQLLGFETFEDGFIGAGAASSEPSGIELESYFESVPEASQPVDDTRPDEPASLAPDQAASAEQSLAEPVVEEVASFEESVVEDAAVEPAFVEQSFGEAVVAEAAPDDSIIEDGQEVLADGGLGFVEPEPAEAFVTETMADLYLQQGHIESARDIYQRLVEQHPGEQQLRDRLRAIEGRLAGRSARVGEPVEGAATEPITAAAPAAAGPTIRQYLIGLMKRQPGAALGDAPSGASGATPATVDDHSAHGAEDRTPRNAGQPRETISGSIDALFSGVAAPADTSAASALAQAFAVQRPEDSALEGMPAHRASSELSLDHVFKSTQAPRPEPESSSFSFDQFFADELAEPSKAGTEPPAASGDPGDDLAQFNSWLNGLKKT